MNSTDPAAGAAPEQGAAPAGSELLVLVTASWCAPARPAVTILRELSRRWGPDRTAVHLLDPEPALLDALGVEVLPTWLLLEHAGPGEPAAVPDTSAAPSPSAAPDAPDAERCTTGRSTVRRTVRTSTLLPTPTGERIELRGSWTELHRRTGALPKHVIDEEFGPLRS
ncbi:hypothetical protein C1N80_02835 [Brachybacterium sp. SGAir0954]|nr:hypothetical protein C1N80_02835 [Brachybacterium sp. SGAir0954]